MYVAHFIQSTLTEDGFTMEANVNHGYNGLNQVSLVDKYKVEISFAYC